MILFRLPKVSVLLVIAWAACTSPENREVEELKKHTQKLQREVDSLKRITAADTPARTDTTAKEPVTANATPSRPPGKEGQLTAGKHLLTLQWISWDEPGSVMIKPAEGGWFSIEGSQKSRRNDDYLTIKGLIRQISATELEFKGEIKSVIETINGGEPCIRTGNKIFETTKNRKYWRLQDMINCEGGTVTDYVDIYF